MRSTACRYLASQGIADPKRVCIIVEKLRAAGKSVEYIEQPEGDGGVPVQI